MRFWSQFWFQLIYKYIWMKPVMHDFYIFIIFLALFIPYYSITKINILIRILYKSKLPFSEIISMHSPTSKCLVTVTMIQLGFCNEQFHQVLGKFFSVIFFLEVWFNYLFTQDQFSGIWGSCSTKVYKINTYKQARITSTCIFN